MGATMKLKITFTALVDLPDDENVRENFEIPQTEEEALAFLRDSCLTIEELFSYIVDGPFQSIKDNIEIQALSPAEADALLKELH